MEQQHSISQAYEIAAETIKNAILQGQYEAAKGVNRIQLATYFSVGKYVSANTRHGVWGTGALETISSRLRQLLPGLRGYSADSLKLMRIFYEEWKELDAKGVIRSGNGVQAIYGTQADVYKSKIKDKYNIQ